MKGKKSMEKLVRLFSVLLLFSTLTFGFISCSDDESLDNYWASIVTVNKIGENKYDFTLDNGKKVWVSSPEQLKPEKGYDRALIYYTILSDKKDGYDYSVRLSRFYEILTKKPIYIAQDDKENQDSIGNDAIKIHSMWEGGGYLNISFGFDVGEKATHLLNLVSADSELDVDKDLVSLEFRHNQSGDLQNYAYDSYVSFDLSPYLKEGRDKVSFEIKWKDFGGEMKSKTIEYKYGAAKDEAKISNVRMTENVNMKIY